MTKGKIVAGCDELLINGELIVRRDPDFIAKVAGIARADDGRRYHADCHLADVKKLECIARDTRPYETLQKLARPRSCNHEAR